MVHYTEYLKPEDARSLCDARIDSICREAFSHYLTAQANYAMDNEESALRFEKTADSLNSALDAIVKERAKWEVTGGNDDQ